MTSTRSTTRDGRTAAAWVAAWLALLAGLGNAAVSGYWATGGTGLLDTVGGVFERAGRNGGAKTTTLLWVVVAVKVLAAVLPVLVLRPSPGPMWQRLGWALAWVEAAILTVYGLVLTTTGLLVQAGVLRTARDADHRALAWHAYLWDPWFLVWGLLVIAALLCGGPRRRSQSRTRSGTARASHG
ncbi:MAG: DUF3995 domain-containing protein [Mycobacteriales bacterium]